MTFLEILAVVGGRLIEALFITIMVKTMTQSIAKSSNTFFTKINFIKLFCIILVSCIITKSIDLFVPSVRWLKSLVLVGFITFSTVLVYKTHIFKGFIMSIISLVSSAIVEILIALILTALNIDAFSLITNTYYSCIYGCVVVIITTLLVCLVCKSITSVSKVENKFKYFLPQLITIAICMFPTMALLMLNDFKYSGVFIVVNLIQLIAVALTGVFNLKFTAKHENTETELANTIVYNETLSKVNEGVRGFKHDMGNIVQAILGYIAINDIEGAKNYCQNLVLGFNDINILSILSPQVIDDPAIYGVVVNKILIAREKGMTLSLDISTSVSEINFPKFELSRILGILIDNAIEAGEQTEDKKLVVNMRHDYKDNTDIITISNSINDVNIDVDKMFLKNYSTKEKPSGFGLYEVKKFLKKYKTGTINTTIDESTKLLTQTLTFN